MQIAIVGLARSGKTTVFNTLTHGSAETGGFGGMTVNVGVVKVPDERLTRTGFFVGTLQYVAPEALSGALVDEAADIYSLATIAL